MILYRDTINVSEIFTPQNLAKLALKLLPDLWTPNFISIIANANAEKEQNKDYKR